MEDFETALPARERGTFVLFIGTFVDDQLGTPTLLAPEGGRVPRAAPDGCMVRSEAGAAPGARGGFEGDDF